LMTPRVLKVLRNFQLDSVFHMGQDCAKIYWCSFTPFVAAKQK
jgi:hypothetical protein